MPKAPISIPRSSGHLPKNCDFCGARNSMRERELQQEVTIQGESFQCLVPRTECSRCQVNFSTASQAEKAIEAGVAAFQKSHGLLTACDIREMRTRLGWTQQDLVENAKVSIASVKRWERGRQVQTAGYDQILRDALSIGEDCSDLVFVKVSQTRLYIIGELKSFHRETPANPEAKQFQKKPLPSKSLDSRITDQPFQQDCYA